jgi:hypothetical protein
MMPEIGGGILESPLTQSAFGYVVRSATPGPIADRFDRLIPSFSLWATPPSGTERLLAALARRIGKSPLQVVAQFLTRLVRFYLYLALEWGLLPELNAQNLLVAVCFEAGELIPCVRDMQDVFVDAVQAPRQFDARLSDYKTLTPRSADVHERRSFSYDFKLGVYVLDPLIAQASEDPGVRDDLVELVRRLASEHLEGVPQYFGAADQWFRYGNSPTVGRTNYERVKAPPRFR